MSSRLSAKITMSSRINGSSIVSIKTGTAIVKLCSCAHEVFRGERLMETLDDLDECSWTW